MRELSGNAGPAMPATSGRQHEDARLPGSRDPLAIRAKGRRAFRTMGVKRDRVARFRLISTP